MEYDKLSIEELENIFFEAFKTNFANTELEEFIYNIDSDAISEDPEVHKKKIIEYVKHKIYETIYENKELFYRKICIEFDYCNKKNSELIFIVSTYIDAIISTVIGFPVPPVAIASYLVKTKFLDRMCGCNA